MGDQKFIVHPCSYTCERIKQFHRDVGEISMLLSILSGGDMVCYLLDMVCYLLTDVTRVWCMDFYEG